MVTHRRSALLVYGGWEGHQPDVLADYAEQYLLSDYEITRSKVLDVLCAEVLDKFDLIVPIWTFGAISTERERALLESVSRGLGYLGLHGNASAFLESRAHKFMLGGQFVDHPGGDGVSYTVDFLDNDPIVTGLDRIEVVSEQYYLLVDPAVKVLATTKIVADTMPWLKGTEMPVAWKRTWGMGKVFYCSLGHSIDVLRSDVVTTLLARAAAWACRGQDSG